MPDDVSALDLVLTANPALLAVVRLSPIVSLSAVACAALVGVPAIALETSKDDLPLAIGLGMVPIAIAVAVNGLAWAARRVSERLAG